MDIYEALEKLDSFFYTLGNYGECSNEDLELMEEIKDVIYQFARKYEPRAEDLPTDHICNCGQHMHRNRITPEGDAEFICENCNTIWILGRPFYI